MWVDLDIRKVMQAGGRPFELEVRLQAQSKRIVIQGPSGAGKSMTLKAVAGLLTPDIGRILIGGRTFFDTDMAIDMPPRERRTGYLFQDYALFPHLTVQQNVAFGLRHGWINPRTSSQDQRVQEWLKAFDLEGLSRRYPHELSGGQRQRTALARTLVTRPDFLLLDEPFAALDATLRQGMRSELKSLLQQLDVPMILITHDPEDVDVLGETVFRMENGSIVADGGGA
ncbi:MAG TPA: ATP-binding cassette domain-containing protein [Aquabacterium sp.]|nr:ATP-binding cassette domain-containing protein [Aquabacterium sp.]